jgi:hypothetical protein
MTTPKPTDKMTIPLTIMESRLNAHDASLVALTPDGFAGGFQVSVGLSLTEGERIKKEANNE